MAATIRYLLVFLACTLVIAATAAQGAVPAADMTPTADTDAVKTFRLQRGNTTIEDELDLEGEQIEAWVPGIHGGSIQTSLTIGFMNLGTTLLQHDQMIYKYTTEYTYWGDVAIKGDSAFSPTLRIGYSLTPWFALEGFGGLSISKYQATVTNRWARKNDEGAVPFADPPMGEFDAEARSLITLQTGLSAQLYPFNVNGDGTGRLHPFISASVGRIWYDMNSNFTDGAAGTNDLGIGGGVRILADRNVSIRLDAMYHLNSVEFTPAKYFTELDEGTTLVPLNEYPATASGGFTEGTVESFSSQDVNYLAWSIGVHGSF